MSLIHQQESLKLKKIISSTKWVIQKIQNLISKCALDIKHILLRGYNKTYKIWCNFSPKILNFNTFSIFGTPHHIDIDHACLFFLSTTSFATRNYLLKTKCCSSYPLFVMCNTTLTLRFFLKRSRFLPKNDNNYLVCSFSGGT